MVMPADSMALFVRATGIPGDVRQDMLRVTVSRDDTTAIAGKYAVSNGQIEFRPLFPFDPGRTYYASIGSITRELTVPSKQRTPTTMVVRSMPSSDTVPENLLRMYIEFSAPMSRESGVDHITLLDDAGKTIEHAFLPLDGDFWNPAHTRYTLFFDPGRVKTGVLPNEQLGRPMRAGKRYTLVVDSTWRDANGQPLAHSYRRTLVAVPSNMSAIDLAAWRVSSVREGSRDTVTITFPRALDHGLLQRTLGIETSKGAAVEGDIIVGRGERSWSFIPRDAWGSSGYRVLILADLEDPSGNRIGRPFEVDEFDRVDSSAASARHTIPLVVKR
jgi:hypothetical protein